MSKPETRLIKECNEVLNNLIVDIIKFIDKGALLIHKANPSDREKAATVFAILQCTIASIMSRYELVALKEKKRIARRIAETAIVLMERNEANKGTIQ